MQSKYEYRSEDVSRVSSDFMGRKPIPMLARLAELEDQGFEIFSLLSYGHSNMVQVIYRRPR